MSSEGKPKNGLLGALSGNVTAIVQAGALGLLALFIFFMFQITRERLQATREELRELRKALVEDRRELLDAIRKLKG